MSSIPTHRKSPRTSKVNSFLLDNSFPTLLDGMLRHLLSHVDTRSVTTTTRTREDDQGARGMESDKTVAWKRRRKRSQGEEEELLKSQAAVLPPEAAVLPPGSSQRYYRQRYRPRQPSGGPSGSSSGTAAVLPPPSGTTARRSGTTAAGRQARQEASSGTTARSSGTTAAEPDQHGMETLILSHLPPFWVNTINRHLPPPDLDRLGFEIRVELDSFFSKVSFLP